MKKILFVILVLIAFQGQTQTPYTKVHYNINLPIGATATAPANHNGVLMSGPVNYQTEIGFIFTDSLGNPLRAKKMSFMQMGTQAKVLDLIRTSDTCHVLAGAAFNSTSSNIDAFIAKIDSLGDTLWTTGINTAQNVSFEATAIIESLDSGYAVVCSQENGSGEISLVRLDQQGNLLWSRSFSDPNSLYATAVSQASDGSFYIAGKIGMSAAVPKGFLLHVAQDGTPLWAKQYYGMPVDDLFLTEYGAYLQYVEIQQNYVGVLRTDSMGEAVWARSYESVIDFDNDPRMIMVSDSSLALLSGSSYMSYVAVIDTAGNQLYEKDLVLNARDIYQTPDNGFLIAGYGPTYGIKSLMNQWHIGVIKTDSSLEAPACIFDKVTTPMDLVPASDTLVLTVTANNCLRQTILLTVDTLSFVTISGCVDQLGGLGEGVFSNITVYPNASTGIFHLEQQSEEDFAIAVYNAFGQKIYTGTSEGKTTTIDLTENTSGIYFYRITYTDRRTMTGKLVLGE